MLTRLAAERATGVLVRERGTLYLAEGRVVHAESPRRPRPRRAAHRPRHARRRGLAGRGGQRPAPGAGSARSWSTAAGHARARWSCATWARCTTRRTSRSAPSSTPARFRYGAAHWLGSVRPVPVAAVERETLRRRELLHRIWPDPATDSAPLLRADAGRGAAVAARQARRTRPGWTACARRRTSPGRWAGRPSTPWCDVRRLAAAGLVTPQPAARRRSPRPQPLDPSACRRSRRRALLTPTHEDALEAL